MQKKRGRGTDARPPAGAAAVAQVLHKAVREKDAESFRAWSSALDGRPLTALRDLLELVPAGASGRAPVDVAEVA